MKRIEFKFTAYVPFDSGDLIHDAVSLTKEKRQTFINDLEEMGLIDVDVSTRVVTSKSGRPSKGG